MSPAEKKTMIAPAHPNLSIVRQCKILELSRSAFYYTPVGIDEETLVIMTAIDQAFTKPLLRQPPTAGLFAPRRDRRGASPGSTADEIDRARSRI
jgi:hypothetical protein